MNMLPILSSLPWRCSNLHEKVSSSPARREDEGEDQDGVLVAQSNDEKSDDNRVDSSKDS